VINFRGVESDYDRTVNDNHGSGQITEFLEVSQGGGILRHVPLLKLQALLRKILFRLIAEHSSMLGVEHDAFRHSLPPGAGPPFSCSGGLQSAANPLLPGAAFVPVVDPDSSFAPSCSFGLGWPLPVVIRLRKLSLI